MILIPQIYLKNGKVVLLEGTRASLFQEDFAATARAIKDAGAEAIHVVDLGVGPVGASPHLPLLQKVHEELGLAFYVGGGFKTTHAIEAFIERGFELVVLGSVAYQQPAFLEEAAKKFPAHVGVHIDVKANRVTIPGYTVVANKTALDYAERFVGSGVRYIFYSDVGAGGAMADEHYERLALFSKQVAARIICTSEVASLPEIERVTRLSLGVPRLDGLVLGKPLYEGRLELHTSIALVNDIVIEGGDDSTLTEM